MNKPIKPNITIPASFADNGVKVDFDNDLLEEGFSNLNPDVLAGDNLNKFIDDTYKGLNYGMAAADAINLINEGETLTVKEGLLVSGKISGGGNLPVFCANSGNTDENGNADLLYLPSMGTQQVPFQLDGTLTLTSGAMYSYSANSSKINFSEWTNGSGARSSSFDYTFATRPQCPCIFSAIKTSAVNGYLTITATAYYDDGTNEVVFNQSVPTTTTQFSCGQQGQKLVKLNFECYYTYTNSQYSNAIVDIAPITETITISTSTSCYFKVGASYPNIVATSTANTFEKSYLQNIDMSSEVDGIYNVFISETVNPYALANTIYRQKTQPTANTNDVWLNTAIQPYKAYKYNGSEWVEFLDVPIGSMVVIGEIIASVKTFPYNIITEKEEITSWGMLDWSGAISANVAYTSSNKFVAPADGYLIYGYWGTASGALYVNNTVIGGMFGSGQGHGIAYPLVLLLEKGDTFYQQYANNTTFPSINNRFIPLKGAN